MRRFRMMPVVFRVERIIEGVFSADRESAVRRATMESRLQQRGKTWRSGIRIDMTVERRFELRTGSAMDAQDTP